MILAVGMLGTTGARAEEHGEDGEQGDAAEAGDDQAGDDQAGDDQAGDDEPACGTVVVARGVPEDPLDSLRAVDVVDRQALVERRPRTVPEALEEGSAAYVQKTNHAGGSPIIRGMVGPQNLILIDGVRLNNSTYRTGPLQYLNTVDSFSLQRIELMRGPGSVLYGSDAIGGVIDLITLDPVRPAEGQTARFTPLGVFRGRTADWERSGRAALSLDTEPFGLIGGASFHVFDDLRAGGDLGVQPWSGYNEVDWDAKVRIGKPGRDRVEVLYQSVRVRDAGRTDKLETNGELRMYEENYRDLVAVTGHLRIDPIRTRVTITPSWQRQLETASKTTFADPPDYEQVAKFSRNRDVVNTVGGTLRLDTRLLARRLDLLYGVEYYHDFVHSEAWSGASEEQLVESTPTYPEGSNYDTFGAYALVTGTPLRTAEWVELVVHGGVRFAAFAAEAPGIEGIGDVTLQNQGGVAAAGVRLRKRGVFNVGIGFDEGFRAPNLMEAARVGDTGSWFHVPNDQLGPERAETIEASGRVHAGPVTIGAVGYFSFLRDYITRVPATHEGQDDVDGTPVVQNVNAGNGRVGGVEGSLWVDTPIWLGAGGDVTWTRGEYDDPTEGWVPLTRIPPLFGGARVRFSPPWRHLFVEVYGLFAGKQDRLSPLDLTDPRIPEDGTPGWFTLNVRAGVRPLDWLQVSVGGANLTNELYKVHGSGVYGPGATAWISVEVFEG